jgi:predicted  nucleic acid-binding Zn-ribbon protein
MAIIKPEEIDQNVAQAPTLGRQVGSISQGGGTQPQRRNVSQRGSGFTNLQQYVTANENNANPELVRQRTAQAGTGLQQAQTGFENVAQKEKNRLQGIQGVNTFVGGVLSNLQNPNISLPSQSDIDRFKALRTGSEVIENPNEEFRPLAQARTGFESQREQLAGGLRRDVTGTGLQEFIRSQRTNPSLATQGENVLDRFLTESTTAGKTALQQAQEKAAKIQETVPEIENEITALRQQINPLQYITQQKIQSGISPFATEQENYLKNLNDLFIAQRVGLGSSFQPNLISLQNVGGVDALAVPDLTYIKPEDLGNVTRQNVENARTQWRAYTDFNKKLQDTNKDIDAKNAQIANAKKAGFDLFDPTGSQLGRLENELNNLLESKKGLMQNNLSGLDVSMVPAYEQYLNRLGKSRQQLLEDYDPNRLARINALSQLSGTNFQNLLGSTTGMTRERATGRREV